MVVIEIKIILRYNKYNWFKMNKYENSKGHWNDFFYTLGQYKNFGEKK